MQSRITDRPSLSVCSFGYVSATLSRADAEIKRIRSRSLTRSLPSTNRYIPKLHPRGYSRRHERVQRRIHLRSVNLFIFRLFLPLPSFFLFFFYNQTPAISSCRACAGGHARIFTSIDSPFVSISRLFTHRPPIVRFCTDSLKRRRPTVARIASARLLLSLTDFYFARCQGSALHFPTRVFPLKKFPY